MGVGWRGWRRGGAPSQSDSVYNPQLFDEREEESRSGTNEVLVHAQLLVVG